jgi:hypothetical protein
MRPVLWIHAESSATASKEDRWYGNPNVRRYSKLFWLQSNRKARLAEAVEYLDAHDIEYAVLQDQRNRGQYVIGTDGDVNPDRPLPDGYFDENSSYWAQFK